MCAFDRSKFKGASLKKISEGVKEAETNSKTAKGSTGDSTRTKYHQLEEGDNWFKIAPAHDPDDSPYVPIAMSNLECEGDVWKDGEKTDEKEVKNRKAFIATVHSPKDSKGKLIVSKDPIETYLTYLNAKLNEEYPDKEEREKKSAPIRGFRAKDKWVFGIAPDHKIATWAWDMSGEIGRLDLSRKQFKDMEKLSIRESADETIPSDIFVDLEEGYPVVVTKTVDPQGKSKKTSYSVSVAQPKKRESWEDFFARVQPTDKQIEDWQAKKPLKDLYVGAYKENDFNMAVDGLQRFDEKWEFGIFDNQEFLDELQEISDMVDKLPKKGEEPKSEVKEKVGKKEEADEELTPIQMKKFLRKYISDNYDEETELPELDKKELVKWYNLAKKGEKLPFPDSEEVEETEETQEVSEDEVESELANLRRRRK